MYNAHVHFCIYIYMYIHTHIFLSLYMHIYVYLHTYTFPSHAHAHTPSHCRLRPSTLLLSRSTPVVRLRLKHGALHHTASHFDTLQPTATPCNALQHTLAQCSLLQHTATHCNTLEYTATHCNTLQHTATHCNTLQHTATHCNTLHISHGTTADGTGHTRPAKTRHFVAHRGDSNHVWFKRNQQRACDVSRQNRVEDDGGGRLPTAHRHPGALWIYFFIKFFPPKQSGRWWGRHAFYSAQASRCIMNIFHHEHISLSRFSRLFLFLNKFRQKRADDDVGGRLSAAHCLHYRHIYCVIDIFQCVAVCCSVLVCCSVS